MLLIKLLEKLFITMAMTMRFFYHAIFEYAFFRDKLHVVSRS